MPKQMMTVPGATQFTFSHRDDRGDAQYNARQLYRTVPAVNPLRTKQSRRRLVKRLFWGLMIFLAGWLFSMLMTAALVAGLEG